MSTGTRDESEAIKVAEKILKQGIPEKVSSKVWAAVIKSYCEKKTQAGEFRPGTGKRVASCLKVFSERCEASSPEAVRLKHLQDYYDQRRKTSEAGARSTLAMIQGFLGEIGHLPGRVKWAKGSKPNARKVVVSLSEANRLIAACRRDDLKFVLFCGFHAGMRAGEIKHSRAAWFDLARGVIAIPAEENQVLPNRKRHAWKTKDGDAREIPISADFRRFLGGFLAGKKGHCLPSRRGSEDGLWDFRLPFEKFMKEQGREDVFPHAMRHSWITELTNSGNHTMQEIAAWSGDRLETIEANYWKRKTEAGALDGTLSGKKKGGEMEEIRAALAGLLEKQIPREKIIEEIQKMGRVGTGVPVKITERVEASPSGKHSGTGGR